MEIQEFKKKCGEVLRSLRLGRELTQEDLAKDLDVALKTYCLWDRGEGLPPIDKYFILIDLLGEKLHTDLRQQTKEPNRERD